MTSISVGNTAPMATAPAVKTRRSKGPITLGGIAMLIAMSASVALEVAAYAARVHPPDFLSAPPNVIAAVLIVPFLIKTHSLRNVRSPIIWMFVAAAVYAMAVAVDGFSAEGFRTMGVISLVLVCFFVGLSTAESDATRHRMNKVVEFFTAIYGITLMALPLTLSNREILAKNLIGSQLLYLAFLFTAARLDQTAKAKTLLFLPFLLIVAGFTTRERLVLGFGFGCLFLIVFLMFFKGRFAHRLVILSAAGIGILSVVFYLNLDSFSSFALWNEFVQRQSGEGIASGREILWPAVWKIIQMKPWLGNGFKLTVVQFTGISASATNAFLTILMNVGWIGLTPILGLLAALSLRVTSYRLYTPWRTFMTIFMAIVLLHNTFESDLIQNNFGIASLLWLGLGFSCARLPDIADDKVLVDS